MIMYEPHPKGILIEYKELEQTSTGVYLPNGVQTSDIEEYNGDIIIAVGNDVKLYQPGDRVMFFPHSMPTSFEGKTDNGGKQKYQMFREADVCCKVLL
jgi:threonine dehydrogenase-like Zn-dependent dehydrogenase